MFEKIIPFLSNLVQTGWFFLFKTDHMKKAT